MSWTVETLNAKVDAELERLPADMRARFVRISELIESHGVLNVGEPYVKHLRGAIWEIRLKGRDGIARALYAAVHRERVVVLRVFVKKTEKIPPAEIAMALDRLKEVCP